MAKVSRRILLFRCTVDLTVGGDGKFAGKNFSNDSLVDPRMIKPERGEPSPGFQG